VTDWTPIVETVTTFAGAVATPAADHVAVRRDGALVLVADAAFLARPDAERDAVRGDPPAPLVLVGAPPPHLDAHDLAALGVDACFPEPASVPVETLALLLARARRDRGDRARFEARHVLDVVASLNAERDPDRLLGRILESMRQLTGADAGTLYVIEGDHLRFRVAQNDSLALASLPNGTLPLDRGSVAGYVALEQRPVNLTDVRRLPPGLPFRFNDAFDARAGYRTVSMLAVPLRAADGEVLGAVQLINRKIDPADRLLDPDAVAARVTPFGERDEQIAMSVAGAASIALVNARLAAEIEHLFDGFVRAAVMAIEARDPTTSGHSHRVSRLALALAEAAAGDGRFGPELPLDRARRRRLEYAALLHDFGKIGVPEEVLVKARKLYPAELDALRHRFELAGLAHEVLELRRALEGGAERAQAEASIARRRAELDHLLARLLSANEPTPADRELLDLVRGLALQSWRDPQGFERPYLTPREHECLTIPFGSLTAAERHAIQDHVRHTNSFLAQIPWGRTLAGLPEVAALHHEKLDGSGYPHGYSGDQIPLESRIITVVDIFDALTASDRPYKSAVPFAAACDVLWGEVDRGRLDRRLVEVFVERNVHRAAGA
jgi:HD-GYP domain-containing protein (c-di-GMP phosphodiesterase class II)